MEVRSNKPEQLYRRENQDKMSSAEQQLLIIARKRYLAHATEDLQTVSQSL